MMRKGIPGTRAGMAMVAIAAAIVGAAGCKKNDAAGDNSGAAAPAAAPAKPAAWKTFKLDKMGIEVKAPGDSQVLDSSADAPNVMMSSSECTVMIGTVTGAYASSFAAAKNEIRKDPNKFQKFTREEQGAKGWHLAYELEDMFEHKPLYGVSIRTTVGAKEFECGRNESDAAKAACVTKICDSIQKPGA